MATDYTTLTTLTEVVPTIITRARLILQATAGIYSTLAVEDSTGRQGVVADFPTFTPVTSSDVETPGEKTATTNVIDLETNAHNATIVENVITFRPSYLAIQNSLESVITRISEAAASAMRAKMEDTAVGYFSGFSQTVAGAGTSLTEAHIWDAIRQIKAANGDVTNLVGVVSPKQYWGPKGLRALIVDADADSGNLGEEMKRMGYVSNAFGIDWLVSNEIDEDVASGGDAAGAIYQRGAIGIHHKSLFDIELQPHAEERYISVVCTGLFGMTEVYDNWGVYALSDVS